MISYKPSTLHTAVSVLIVAALMLPVQAVASGTSMPWETPLQNIVDSITGPVAKGVAILAIVIAGLAMAMGEGGGFFRKAAGIVFGIAIAFAATQWGMTFFGFAGGAGF
jgi:type IV secretory pathway VirB2 component (pilin)